LLKMAPKTWNSGSLSKKQKLNAILRSIRENKMEDAFRKLEETLV